MADDPISAALAPVRERQAKATARENDAALWIGAMGRLADEDVPRLLAALGAVLELHALTALHRHTEPCDTHRYRGIADRKACPDCRVVEWTGCETCRDENSNPARPEDCRERAVILAALTGKGKTDG